jgi:hypothetical protein
MESFTPRSLIAGRLKAARGRELEAVSAAAAAILGTERLAVIHARTQGDIWYLAAPAADIASHPGATTPLGAALPGTSHHEGDGAYTTDLAGGLQAVVVKQGENLHSFVGTASMAKRFVALEGAKVSHPCAGQGQPWQFPVEMRRRQQARLNTVITASGLIVAVMAAGSWLWAAHSLSNQNEVREALQQQQKAAWASAVRALEAEPYPKALANLQKAVEQAVKEKGALVQFEHKDGRASWTLNVAGRPVSGAAN